MENPQETKAPEISRSDVENEALLIEAKQKLHDKLSSINQRLAEEITVKKQALVSSTKFRQDRALELHSVSSQLETLRKLLQSTAPKVEPVDLEPLRRSLDEQRRKLNQVQTQHATSKRRAQEADKALQALSIHNEQVQDTLKVEKTTNSVTEIQLRQAELKKREQDFYIADLLARADELEFDLAHSQGALDSCRRARKDLEEEDDQGALGLQDLNIERKRVLQLWNSALNTLSKRDERLNGLRESIAASNGVILGLANEKSGLEKNLADKERTVETAQEIETKVKDEIARTELKIQTVVDTKAELAVSYSALEVSIESAENELASLLQKHRLAKVQIEFASKEIVNIASAVHATELEIMSTMMTKTTLDKVKSQKLRECMAIKKAANEIEAEITKLSNEMATTKLEIFSLKNSNGTLSAEVLGAIEADIERQSAHSEELQVAMKKTNSEIVKKQNDVELLNKKHDKMAAAILARDGSIVGELGPLEATIHHLQKAIVGKQDEIRTLQSDWIRHQTEVVAICRQTDGIQETLHDSMLQQLVMQRKKTELAKMVDEEHDEIRLITRDIEKVHAMMGKIYSAMHKNERVNTEQQKDEIDLRIGFRNRLKDAETDCLRLESTVERLENERRKATNKLLETERNLEVWKSKVKLAHETASAVKNSYENEEVAQMEVDIQRLKTQHASIVKDNQKLSQTLSSSVDRYCDLLDPQRNGNASSAEHVLKQQIGDLKKRLETVELELEFVQKQIEEAGVQRDALTAKMQELASDDLLGKETDGLTQLNQLGQNKRSNLLEILRLQQRAKRLEQLIKGEYQFACSDANKRQEIVSQLSDKNQTLQTIKEEVYRVKPLGASSQH